jgi:hypothetical protein
LIRQLRSAGFDATQRGSSLVHHPMEKSATAQAGNQQTLLTPERLANLVYLPMFPAMDQVQRIRLADIVRTHVVEQSHMNHSTGFEENKPSRN